MRSLNNLIFVGNANDFTAWRDRVDFSFCLCAKTFHKLYAKANNQSEDGYYKNLSKEDDEYLIAYRPQHRLVVANLVDVPHVSFFNPKVIKELLDFISQEAAKGQKVLIACDQGMSRSPSIAFMYLMLQHKFADCETFDEAYSKFVFEYYADYAPNKGILDFTKNFWEDMKENGKK